MENKLIAHVLIKISGKYLIIKRSKIKRGKRNVFPEYWDIPGGIVEDGELPQEAVIREAKEEANLSIKIKTIIHEDSNLDQEKQIVFTRLVYLSEEFHDESLEIILDPEEHTEFKFICSLEELDIQDRVVPYLEDIMAGKY